jgi:hypothetical protein
MNSVKRREFLFFATAASAAFEIAQAQEIPLRKPKPVVKPVQVPGRAPEWPREHE